MIVIEKNGKRLTVAKSVYNSNFRANGWKPVKAKIVVTEVEKDKINGNEEEIVEGKDIEDDREEVEDGEEDLTEKPISEMSKEELIKLAETYGIETEGKKAKEIKRALKEVM